MKCSQGFPVNPCREIVARRIYFAVKRQSQAKTALNGFQRLEVFQQSRFPDTPA
jgi:hypothetical protein